MMGDKLRQWMYYFIIGVVSMISLCFLPMLGSTIGLSWNLPNTIVGWIVWVATKLIVATLNVLIFHCFIKQAKINIKDDPQYIEAKKLLQELDEGKEFIPRSPNSYISKQYKTKGITIFFTTALSTIALTQALLTFDYVTMLTYLFTIVMGLIFGVMTMKSTEEYWIEEFYEYAIMITKKQASRSPEIGQNDTKTSDLIKCISEEESCQIQPINGPTETKNITGDIKQND